MKFGSLSLVLAAVATATSLAFAAGVPLDVKTGLWEINYVTTIAGAPVIPPDVLAKMTPAQKAKALATANRVLTSKDTDCITAKDLQQGAFGNKDDDSKCTYTPTVATATRNESTVACTGAGAQHGSFKVEAQSQKQVKGGIVMTGSGRTVTVSFTGKWLNASCTGGGN